MKNVTRILSLTSLSLLAAAPAFAQDGGAAAGSAGYIAIGAGLAIGFAAFGGALGQGNAAKAFYESVARNPQAAGSLTGAFYVGMALIESLVIYALVIAYFLQSKI